MGPRDHEDTITPHTRPPADDDGDHMLVRTVECIDGQRRGRARLRARVRLRPRAGGVDARRRRPPRRRRDRRRADDPPALGPRARHRGQPRPRAAHARSRASAPTARSRGPRSSRAPKTSTRPRRGSPRPSRFWRAWLGRARIPDHRFRDPIQRSALAIKGLTYMPTGATVAALTTSLPETPGGERNWDYRYTWMRDTTFTLQALHWLNLDWEADEFMQFVADVEPTEDGSLQIMYGIDGRRDLTESTRDDLSGYAGARPVRIGNGAFDQRQNDVFGAVLDSILLHTRRSAAAAAAALADRRVAGRVRDEGLARARPGHLGGARQAAALRLVEAHVLGRARPRRASSPRSAATPSRRRSGARPPRRSAPTSSSTASPSAASCASTTRPTRSTRRCCSRRSSASSPATTSACAPPSTRSPTS